MMLLLNHRQGAASWCVHVLTSQNMIMLAFYQQLAADW